jgi:cytochrome P450
MSPAAAVWPPGPAGAPVFGSLFDLRRDPIGFLTRTSDEFGDSVHYRLGPRAHAFFFRHPDQVKDVLVTHQHSFAKGRGLQWAKQFLGEGLLTSEGEFHRRQRRLSQPAFHRQRVQSYGTVMTDYAVRARQRWRDGQAMDLAHEMMSLTMAVVAKTLFDADVTGEADQIGESLTAIISLFHRFNNPLSPLIEKLPLPSNLRFRRAHDRLDATIYRMIGERRRSREDRGDLLSMLLLATDTEGDGTGMTDRQLRDEVMTIFLAGHETTANALTWTFYLLSQNPEAEARLFDEVDRVLGGRPPAVEDLADLRFSEQVFAESMRLYPPAWGLGRKAIRDEEIAGYLVPAGAFVVMSAFVTQHDERFFPDPRRFDPDRFTPEGKAARPKFAYFPFGGGARQCIGEPFAWMEGVLILATLAQQWRLRLVPGQRVEAQPLITLRPRYGMRMVPERRGI